MVTAAMVGIDATVDQPRVVSTFTTRDRIGPRELNEAVKYIHKLARQELGPVRSCSFLEFTTGNSRRSGGRRRPHFHTLWKDLDPADSHIVAGIASHVLERACGAYRQEVEEMRTAAGCTMYVARHHLKESQAPPKSWGRTRRVRPSRGYWSRPAGELRTRASAIVREKRVMRRIQRDVERAEAASGSDLSDLGFDLLEKALSAPPVRVVRVCKPWEDPLGAR